MELTVSILISSEHVILDFVLCTKSPCFVSFKLLLCGVNTHVEDSVVSLVSWSHHLESNESILDVRVLDSLTVATINLCVRDHLVVLRIVLTHQLIDVFSGSLISLFSHREVLVEEQLAPLFFSE